MDYLVPIGKGLKLDGLVSGEDLEEFEAFDLYDFKYSNNGKSYSVSGQLHEYKYWYELTHPGHRDQEYVFPDRPQGEDQAEENGNPDAISG